MKVIVGLGNPGSRYAKTRHNVGTQLVESVARALHGRWKEERRLRSRLAEAEWKGIPLLLVLPDSYMNETGEVVKQIASHLKVDFKKDLLVVVDDISLPLGRLRLRPRGQDGGHRGLRSIEEALGSQAYARLRIGIASSEALKGSLEDYVLSPFSRQEAKKLREILERGVESCRLWASESMEKAMDWTNKPTPYLR